MAHRASSLNTPPAAQSSSDPLGTITQADTLSDCSPVAARPAHADVQRRVLVVLAAAQIFGGIGVASGAAVGALLAADLSSDTYSGMAAAASVIGAAIIAIPVARIMDTHGR